MKKTLAIQGDMVANQTLKAVKHEIKARTPVRYTGETRRGWVTVRYGKGKYATVNKTNAAMFLEEGTRGHGPATKKFLFIPLNKKAFFWYRYGKFKLEYGTDYILKKYVRGIRKRQMAGKRINFALRLGESKIKTMIFNKL